MPSSPTSWQSVRVPRALLALTPQPMSDTPRSYMPVILTGAAICGAVLASIAIMWLSFILMICVSKYLLSHKDSREVKDVFKALRPTIIGLIAAAALLLMTKDNFGSPSENLPLFALSIGIFAAAFFFTRFKKTNPILVMFVCGLIGLLFY